MMDTQQSHAYMSTYQFSIQLSETLFCQFERNCLQSHNLMLHVRQSKRQTDELYFHANECIDINSFHLPVTILNQSKSNKAKLVAQWYRDITVRSVSEESIMTLFN